MTHRAVIEAGPATVRRVCCGAAESTDGRAVLEWIDDPVALVDGQPVELPELLRSAMACPERPDSVEIIHPTWWPARRVELFAAAARDLAENVVTRTRAALLANRIQGAVVVEIAARLVAVVGTHETTAEPRIGPPDAVAAAVAARVLATARGRRPAVVIDGAGALATMIAERLRAECQVTVVDALPLPRAAQPTAEPAPDPSRTRRKPVVVVAAAAAALTVVALALQVNHETPTPATYLVEGRLAVQVPADWPVRRVTAGPGSARVEVASPKDPNQVLHLTQAPAAGDTLAAVAEPLQRALQNADPGVFVGFDPADTSAGRPAVTYREVRDGHHVDWVVLVDHGVRIGIGCQSGSGGDVALSSVCEQAVRSAHALT